MMAKSEKMLTASEAAKRLGAAESSVRLWASKGRLPGAVSRKTLVGSYWEIPESALVGFEMSKPGPKPKAKTDRPRKAGGAKAAKRGKR